MVGWLAVWFVHFRHHVYIILVITGLICGVVVGWAMLAAAAVAVVVAVAEAQQEAWWRWH